MTEKNLVERIIVGDSTARTAFYETYKKLIWHVINRIIASEDERNELFQEFFVHVFKDDCRCLAQWRGDNLKAFLTRTLRNLAIDFIRKHRAEQKQLVSWPETQSTRVQSDGSPCDIPDQRPSPETQLLTNELRNTVTAGIALLSVRDQELLTRYFYSEQSYEEIAADMNLKSSNVGVSLGRARERLKAVLQQKYPDLFTELTMNTIDQLLTPKRPE